MDNNWIDDIIKKYNDRECCENCTRFLYADFMRRVGTCNFPFRKVSADECCQFFELRKI